MNLNIKFLLFILSLCLLTSCGKENMENATTETEEVEAEVVECDLELFLSVNEEYLIQAEISGGTAPFVFEWSTGETTEGITVSESGDYFLTLTDAEGCSVVTIISVIVQVDCDDLNVSISENETITILTATVTGGTAPFAYEWSTGDNTSSININLSGDYDVTVTDAEGCTVTTVISVIYESDCSNSTLDPYISQDAGGNVLTATVTGGTPPYNYEWSTGETTQVIEVTDSGDYTLIVTDADGCAVAVNIPVVIEDDCNDLNASITVIGYNLTLVVTGGTEPYSFTWSTGQLTPNIEVVGPGTYEIIITDNEGCTVIASVMVEDPCQGFEFVFDYDDVNSILGATPLSGDEPYTYTWSTGETTETIMVESDSEYGLTLTDALGCEVGGWFQTP